MTANRSRALFFALLVLLALIGGFATGPWTWDSNGYERIEEDDPRWDCRTMGNRICGP